MKGLRFKMNYKQSIYTVQGRFYNEDFEYLHSSFSGERVIERGIEKIQTCNSILEEDCLERLEEQIYKIKKLETALKISKKYMSAKGINLKGQLLLHSERVLIDSEKLDDRSYGFLRLEFKDINRNICIKDIPLLPLKVGEIENRINGYINNYFDLICTNTLNKKGKKEFLNMTHILSPKASGYFIHEIIGHTLEADNYNFYKDKYKNISISKKLTVIDTINDNDKMIGIDKYDDTGQKLIPVTLIEQGKIHNVLAIDLEDSFDGILYGVARRESYKYEVLPRMRFTTIKPFDNIGKKEIINKYNQSILVEEILSGRVNHITGEYELLGNGFIISKGEVKAIIGNLEIQGNIMNDLKNIEYIGNDVENFGGFCGKYGQTVRVGIGGVTISILGVCSRGIVYENR